MRDRRARAARALLISSSAGGLLGLRRGLSTSGVSCSRGCAAPGRCASGGAGCSRPSTCTASAARRGGAREAAPALLPWRRPRSHAGLPVTARQRGPARPGSGAGTARRPHPEDAENLARRGDRHLHLLRVARLAGRHEHGRILRPHRGVTPAPQRAPGQARPERRIGGPAQERGAGRAWMSAVSLSLPPAFARKPFTATPRLPSARAKHAWWPGRPLKHRARLQMVRAQAHAVRHSSRRHAPRTSTPLQACALHDTTPLQALLTGKLVSKVRAHC